MVRSLVLALVGLLAQTAAPVNPQAARVAELINQAHAAQQRADFPGMQRISEEALAASRAAGDGLLTAKSLATLGMSHFLQGHHSECGPILEEALPLAVAAGDKSVELIVLNRLGLCQREVGDYESALDNLQKSAAIIRTMNNPRNEATALINIGQVYGRMGEFELARHWIDRAIAIAPAAKDPTVEAFTLQGLGNLEQIAGRYDVAVDLHRRAFAKSLEGPQSPFVAAFRVETHTNLALNLARAKRYEEAQAAAHDGLALDTELGLNYQLARTLCESIIGFVAAQRGNNADAMKWLGQARATWLRVNDLGLADLGLMTEITIARVHRAEGRRDEALRTNLAVLDSLDRMRAGTNVTSTSSATTAFPVTDAYVDTIDLLMSTKRVAEAYDVSERYRARTFLDNLDERRNGIGTSMTAEQKGREKSITDKIALTQMRLWAHLPSDPAHVAARSEMIELDEKLDALRREVRRQDPRAGSVRFPTILTSGEVSRLVSRDTVFLSYVVGQDRSYAWAITSDGVQSAILPGRDAISASVADYRKSIGTRPDPLAPGQRRTALRANAAALTRMLLTPIATAIRGRTRVIVAPDGVLNDLPFEALAPVLTPRTRSAAAPPQWFTEQAAVSYAPSASALAALTAPSASAPSSTSRGLFAIGDPAFAGAAVTRGDGTAFAALPFTRTEVQRISALFPNDSRALLGAAAVRTAVESAPLDQYRFLHFATHAFVNTSRPGRSGIVLSTTAASPGGVIHADDVMRMRLNAELVTLSACSTGVGKTVAGEGVFGLARGFLYAGSRSVAASLWNINDAATATLMTSFYRNLKAGRPRDEALAAARRSLIRGTDERLKDPYYWAPFILIGAAR